MIKGNKQDVVMIEKELKMTSISITFANFTMKRKLKDKYLVQIIHEDGLEASVAATVEDRAGKFKGTVFEIRFKEFSKQSISVMMAAKILLEKALLPSLIRYLPNLQIQFICTLCTASFSIHTTFHPNRMS